MKIRKLVITGASGFVGQQIYGLLENPDLDIYLVGRDTERLSAMFTNVNCVSYQIMEGLLGPDCAVLHLATVNNDTNVSFEKFIQGNVEFLGRIVSTCLATNVSQFINVTSVNCFDTSDKSNYTVSKRIGADFIEKLGKNNFRNIYLGAVYGCSWPKKLSVLNKIPQRIATGAFNVLAAIKVTTNIEIIAEYVLTVVNMNEQNFLTLPIILADEKDENVFYKSFRWFIDTGFCFSVIFFLGWLMILIFFVNFMWTRGHPIFVQNRVGRSRKVFRCFKFRTMPVETMDAPTHEVGLASLPRFSKFLRNSKIDELPQVFNILKGDMHLVGARPSLPSQVKLNGLRKLYDVYRQKPGITGWSQINRLDMSNPERLAVSDYVYSKLKSIETDLRIVLKTFKH